MYTAQLLWNYGVIFYNKGVPLQYTPILDMYAGTREQYIKLWNKGVTVKDLTLYFLSTGCLFYY